MFSANYILKICIFLSVLVYTQGSKSQSGEKKINIKIGFDLTQGENGAPSLKIRDFEKETPELHARASEKDGPMVRADSFSENSAEKSSEKKTKDSASKEHAPGRQGSKSKESSDDDDDSDEKRGISTRGMDAEEYEPEAARIGKGKPNDKSKESKSSSGEESASGGDKEDGRRRSKRAARLHEDAPRRAKRNVPTLKGLMENIRKRKTRYLKQYVPQAHGKWLRRYDVCMDKKPKTRELFVADRRQAELKAKKS